MLHHAWALHFKITKVTNVSLERVPTHHFRQRNTCHKGTIALSHTWVLHVNVIKVTRVTKSRGVWAMPINVTDVICVTKSQTCRISQVRI